MRGRNVALAPLTDADSATLFSWVNDRELVILNRPFRPVSEASHRSWFERIRQREDTVILGIRLVEANELIGSCQLHSIDSVSRSAELQIRIASKNHRGHGYGAEALCLLLDHAFDDLNLHRVYLHVFATNMAARRVYERLGFVEEGVLRDGAFIDGQYVDVIAMGLLEEQFVRSVDTSTEAAGRPGARARPEPPATSS